LVVSNNLIKPLLWYYREVTQVFRVLQALHKLQEVSVAKHFFVGTEEGGIRAKEELKERV
jgi:hypothetical protein